MQTAMVFLVKIDKCPWRFWGVGVGVGGGGVTFLVEKSMWPFPYKTIQKLFIHVIMYVPMS